MKAMAMRMITFCCGVTALHLEHVQRVAHVSDETLEPVRKKWQMFLYLVLLLSSKLMNQR